MSRSASTAQNDFEGRQSAPHEISVIRDFSDDPFGRFPSDGPNNGERFRDDYLKPALDTYNKVHVDLDGNFYGSSFLEEAFGGMVRKGYFQAADLANKLTVFHSVKSFEFNVWRYINEAEFGSG